MNLYYAVVMPGYCLGVIIAANDPFEAMKLLEEACVRWNAKNRSKGPFDNAHASDTKIDKLVTLDELKYEGEAKIIYMEGLED